MFKQDAIGQSRLQMRKRLLLVTSADQRHGGVADCGLQRIVDYSGLHADCYVDYCIFKIILF
jgi:hypothetical protein